MTQSPERPALPPPREVSLGEQVITLRGAESQLRISVSVSTEDPLLMQRVVPLRGRLISMLYFLLSHRVPEALRTPSGEERLRRDLHQRYTNLLRSPEFELHFNAFALEEREAVGGADEGEGYE